MPNIGKCLERIIINRINFILYNIPPRRQIFIFNSQHNLSNDNDNEHFTSVRYDYENQGEFTNNKCTEDIIFKIKRFVNKSREKRKLTAFISLDIANAFNECLWERVISSLHLRKIPEPLIGITRDYFNARFLNVFFANHTALKRTEMGCPQGSTCGPGFWNIAYDDIFRVLNCTHDSSIKVFAYADDTYIMVSGDNIHQLKYNINNILKKFLSYPKFNNQRVHEKKQKLYY